MSTKTFVREVGSPLWICEDCGGPAVWTFIASIPHYHCERQCDGFMQVELFEGDGVVEVTRGDEAQDAGRSTSGVDELEELPF